MHYQVRIKTPAQAVAECKKWFGSNFKRIEAEVFLPIFNSNATKHHKLRLLYLSMSFGGVSGRGVIHGLYRHYSNPLPAITQDTRTVEAA
jgi:hypothetical protein